MRRARRSTDVRNRESPAKRFSARGGACRAAGLVGVGLLLCGAGPAWSPHCAAEDVAVATAPQAPEETFRRMVEQQALQYEPMIQNALMADLELLRTLHADLPIESRQRIAAAGGKAVKEASLQVSEVVHAGQRPRGVAVNNAGDLVNGVAEFFNVLIGVQPIPPDQQPPESKEPDPFDHLRAALIASVVEELGAEAGRNLADEFSQREQRRRQACVRRLVASLDEFLFLTSKQRDEIEASLGLEWREGMAMAAESQMIVNGRKVFLGLPYKRILPHLTAAQKEQLGNGKEAQGMEESTRRQMWQSRLWRQMNMGQQVERDPWWFE